MRRYIVSIVTLLIVGAVCLPSSHASSLGFDVREKQPQTTKGDIAVHNGTTVVRLAVGTNGQHLSADSSTASGLVWATPASGGGSGETNTASNVGNGSQVFKQKSGVDFEFKTLVSGDLTTLTADSNSISINVAVATSDVTGTLDIANTNLSAGTLNTLTAGGVLNTAVATSDVTGTWDVGNTNLSGGTLTTLTAGGVINVAVATGDVTGIWAVEDGGTGQTDQTEGFDALSPTTTKGDIIVSNGSDNVRLAVGTNGQVLSADSSTTTGLRWVDGGAFGGGGGETNTASNLGNGVGVFASKSGVDLRFKSLVSGDNVIVTQDANSIVVGVTQMKCGTIPEPDQIFTVSQDVVLMNVDSTTYPDGIVLERVMMTLATSADSTYVWLAKDGPTAPSGTKLSETATSTSNAVNAEAPDTASTINAGQYLIVSIDATDVAWSQVCFEYR